MCSIKLTFCLSFSCASFFSTASLSICWRSDFSFSSCFSRDWSYLRLMSSISFWKCARSFSSLLKAHKYEHDKNEHFNNELVFGLLVIEFEFVANFGVIAIQVFDQLLFAVAGFIVDFLDLKWSISPLQLREGEAQRQTSILRWLMRFNWIDRPFLLDAY